MAHQDPLLGSDKKIGASRMNTPMPHVTGLSPTYLERHFDRLKGFASLNNYKSHAKRWRLGQYVATLSAGTAIAQCFNIALAPLITRLYTPEDLGAMGLFASFLSVAVVCTSLKYELGIVSSADEAEAGQLSWAAAMFCFPVSVLAGGILYAAIRNGWFGFGALPRYAVSLMVPTLLLTGIFGVLRYWGIRQERFGLISKTSISQSATRSISQTAMGFLGAGMAGLFWGELAGRAVGVGSMFRESWPYLRRYGAKGPGHQLASTLKRNCKLPIYSLPSSLIDSVAVSAAVPLLVQLYGSQVGGHFALVQKVLAVPLTLVAASVADAFHSRLAVCARDTPQNMLSLFKHTSGALLLLGLAPALILVFAGNRLFAFIFGYAWSAAGTLAAISAPWFLAQFVVSPLSRLVFVLRGQESKLIYDLVLLAGIFGTYELARVKGLSITGTVTALMVVNTVAYLLYYAVLLHIVAKSTPTLATQSLGNYNS